jgi:hypothetical protein
VAKLDIVEGRHGKPLTKSWNLTNKSQKSNLGSITCNIENIGKSKNKIKKNNFDRL